ncbi:collagen alpha-3(VI) chain-like [Pecten maximus]|uniref:collagen alpha-3(VI) chain-like n=1 Tax=Pecten maximus TaxID=6579 RepID=UPI001458CEC0|nr:collagen alpha-3(VI) chain-like [Pecten maximus]
MIRRAKSEWQKLETSQTSFPNLDLEYLETLTCRTYQLKLAPDYITEHHTNDSDYEYTDIVFVLDTSGSISNQGKLQAVNFIYNVTEWLTIGPDDILVSVVTFNTSPKEHFKLKQFNNKSELLPQIKQVAYGNTRGTTDTAEALRFVRQNSFLLQNGGRPNANTTVVLLTDGQSDDRSGTLHEASWLKSTMNTEIFVVGIGSAVSRSNDEIRGVSSDPDSYYIQQVDSFIYLCNLVPAMVPKLDIVFLVDTSGSISNQEESQAVNFIYNVTKWLTIAPDDIRVSVVTFNSEPKEQFKLTDYNKMAELLQHIKQVANETTGGGTNTAKALRFVREHSFLLQNGGRPNANSTVILLTDGQSYDPVGTLREAGSLKSNNTELFAIGIGSALSTSNGEIRGVSSDPDSYYVQQVDSFIYLCNLVPALVPKLDPSSQAMSILNCPTPPPTTTQHQSSGVPVVDSSTTTPTTPYQLESTTNTSPTQNGTHIKDIVFLVDTSGSISDQEESQAVNFIYNVTKWLTVGVDDIRVSVVTFNSEPREQFKLRDYNKMAELLQHIKQVANETTGGGTNTAKALRFVREHSFLLQNGGRPNANRTVILLTDGQSDDPVGTLREAGSFKSNNTELFAIGIGSALSTSNGEIRGVSSDPDSYYVQQVDSFIYLCNLVPALVPKLDPSSQAMSILNCPTPPPTTTQHQSSGVPVVDSSTTTPTTPYQLESTTNTSPTQNSTNRKDIVFLVDTSGSISDKEESQAVNFIYNVTKWLTIGPDDIRVSVVTYSNIPKEHFKLRDYNTRAELLQHIKQVTNETTGGTTNTSTAFSFVSQNSFLLQNGGRPNANRTVILLTDGKSNDPVGTLREADLLKSENNTEIFAIGIGSAVVTSNDEIRGVSSDPDSYYVQQVDSFIYLCNLVPDLVPKLDPSPKVMSILNCPTPPPTTTKHQSSGVLVMDSSTTTPPTPYQLESTTNTSPIQNGTNRKDIVFLVDTSGSISNQEESQAVSFIYNVTKWLTIGLDDIRVSVVTFNSKPKEQFKLRDYNKMAELLQHIKQVANETTGGGTNTAKALRFVRQNSFLLQNGGRPNANRTVVLLTDGQSGNTSETLREAGSIKSNNTELFAIGIGSALSTSNDEIRGVSSDPDSYYVQQVDSFIYLCNLVPALVPKLDSSSQAMSILNCPTPPPTTTQHRSSDVPVVESSTTTPPTPPQPDRTTNTYPIHKSTDGKDIVFLVDTSGSISNQEETLAVNFIYDVTKWLTIAPDDIQVSVVTFNSEPKEQFKLRDYNKMTELLQHIKQVANETTGGGTNTAKALRFVRQNSFLLQNGGRPNANRTVILLTDGQLDDPLETLREAGSLKSNNTELFAIGIGSAVSTSNDEIRGVSSDPDSYYVQQVDSFIYLCNLVPALVPKLDPSSKAMSILNCPTPPPTTSHHNIFGVTLSSYDVTEKDTNGNGTL